MGWVTSKALRKNHGSGRSEATAIHGNKTNGIRTLLAAKNEAAAIHVNAMSSHHAFDRSESNACIVANTNDIDSNRTVWSCASKNTGRVKRLSFHFFKRYVPARPASDASMPKKICSSASVSKICVAR